MEHEGAKGREGAKREGAKREGAKGRRREARRREGAKGLKIVRPAPFFLSYLDNYPILWHNFAASYWRAGIWACCACLET
ncbi:MAG: hypothetical protein WA029_15105 [Anaerolineae bacterium]